MRKRYSITMEEHKDSEAKILEAKRTPASLGSLLIVDDEKTILLTYAAILRRHGYTVHIAESIQEAMAILEKEIPDLILSDVMFPSPTEGGFEFYQSGEEQTTLRQGTISSHVWDQRRVHRPRRP